MNFDTPKNRFKAFNDMELNILSNALYTASQYSYSPELNLMYQQIAEEITKRRLGIAIGGGANHSNN